MATRENKTRKKNEDKKNSIKLDDKDIINSIKEIVIFDNKEQNDNIESETIQYASDESCVQYETPLSDIIIKKYEGEELHGLYHGKGKIIFMGGNTYEGELSEGYMHGYGKYTWLNGQIYEGDFSKNSIHGKGNYTWPNGSSYIGEVYNGKRHGFGTFTSNDGDKVYTGYWYQSCRHGKGKLEIIIDDMRRSYYDGDWVMDVREGVGTRLYPSGNIYTGSWTNNVRHGEGCMQWLDSDQVYEGMWNMGIQHGWGQHVWFVSRMPGSQYPLRNTYVGEFVNGKRHGYGTFIYSNGTRYEGDWEDNVKCGEGKFIFKNGRVYEGTFLNNRIVEYPDFSGSESPDMSEIRTRTPLPAEVFESPSTKSKNTLGPSLQIEINDLLGDVDESQRIIESKQLTYSIMHYMSVIRHMYSFYSSLGLSDKDSPDNTFVMKRMQLWRFIKDCRIHHHGYSLCEMDRWTGIFRDGYPLHDPNEKILLNDFTNIITIIAYHIHKDLYRNQEYAVSKCFSKLFDDHIASNACTVKGRLYCDSHKVSKASEYSIDAYSVYIQLSEHRRYPPFDNHFTMRQFLLMMKDCQLIHKDFTTRDVLSVLAIDDPNVMDDGFINLEIEMTFLEFFEALIACAELYVTDEMIDALKGSLSNDQSKENEINKNEDVEIDKNLIDGLVEAPVDNSVDESTPTQVQHKQVTLVKIIEIGDDADESAELSETPVDTDVPEVTDMVQKEASVTESELELKYISRWFMQVEIFLNEHFFPPVRKLITRKQNIYKFKPTNDDASENQSRFTAVSEIRISKEQSFVTEHTQDLDVNPVLLDSSPEMPAVA